MMKKVWGVLEYLSIMQVRNIVMNHTFMKTFVQAYSNVLDIRKCSAALCLGHNDQGDEMSASSPRASPKWSWTRFMLLLLCFCCQICQGCQEAQELSRLETIGDQGPMDIT